MITSWVASYAVPLDVQSSAIPKGTTMRNPKHGFVFYRGPSMIDGEPIVAVAVKIKAKSANAKTGHMVQTMILRDDINPVEAIKTGDDRSICGDCQHRPNIAKLRKQQGKRASRCYVNVGQAPRAVWECLHNGNGYAELTPEDGAEVLRGLLVRCGTYGDPMAVPFEVWAALLKFAAGHTGYTHQWQHPDADQRFRAICMASADDQWEYDLAKSRGWRVFRVMAPGETLGDREIACPASAEAGQKTNCAACKACGGLGAKAKVDIGIVDHGPDNRKKAA